MNLKHNAYESMSKLYCGFTTGSQEELLWLMDVTRYIGYLEGKISELKSKDEEDIDDIPVEDKIRRAIKERGNA